MRNPFSIESKADKQYRQNLERWKQMASVTSATDRVILSTQPREVIELTGPRIEREFSLKARNSGELYPLEEKDFSGRDTVRYYGDIAKTFEHFNLPTAKIKLGKVVHFEGRPYLEGQIPPAVQRAMLLRANGFAE